MTTKLKLIQLLRLAGINIEEYKIHCAIDTSKNNRPLDDFFAGKFKDYQEIQTKKNFNKPYILSLININDNDWLFAGLWKVIGIETDKYRLNNKYYFKYQTKELKGLDHLTGKALKKKLRMKFGIEIMENAWSVVRKKI